MANAMIITGVQPFSVTPVTNSSVMITTIIEILNQIIPRVKNLIGRVIIRRIPHTMRFTRPSIKTNTKRELVTSDKTTPVRYLY